MSAFVLVAEQSRYEFLEVGTIPRSPRRAPAGGGRADALSGEHAR